MQVGGYELSDEIGRGSAGVVYRARDTRLGREVALKVLGTDSAPRDDESLRRFEREARVGARLAHPGIVAVYDLGVDADRAYIAMELVPGETLLDRIRRQGGPARDLETLRAHASMVRAIAEALDVAHRSGVLHRDVKPGNILVGPDGASKLSDFGLARDERSATALTEEGRTLGTPAYMAPEQVAGRLADVDVRSDVYGLGATLYHAVTGRPPYEGDRPWRIAHRVLTEDPPAVRRLAPLCPAPLEAIIERAMARDQGRRFASARDLADELGRFLSGGPVYSRAATRAERLGSWRRRRPVLSAALLVGGLATALLTLLFAGLWLRSNARFVAELRDQRDRADQAAALAHERARIARGALGVLVHDVRDRLDDLAGESVRRAREELLTGALADLERLRDAEVASRPISVEAFEANIELGDLARDAGRAETATAAYVAALATARRLVATQGDEVEPALDLALALERVGAAREGQGDLAGAVQAFTEAIEDADRGRERGRLGGALRGANVSVQPSKAFDRVRDGCAGGATAGAPKVEDAPQLGSPAPEGAAALRADAQRGSAAQLSASRNDSDVLALQGASSENAGRERMRADDLRAGQIRVLALVGLSTVCRRRADGKAAQAYLERSLADARAVHALDGGAPEGGERLAQVLEALGELRGRQGDLDAALAAREEALALRRELLAAEPRRATPRRDVAASLERLGCVLRERHELEAALRAFDESRRISAELAAESPGDATLRYELSLALDRVGDVELERGGRKAALDAFEESLGVRRALVARDPSAARMARALALVLDRVGAARLASGDLDGGAAAAMESLALLRRLAAASPLDEGVRRDLAMGLVRAGDAHLAQGDLARFFDEFRELAAISPTAETIPPSDLGEALVEHESFDPATRATEEALGIFRDLGREEGAGPPSASDLAGAWWKRGSARLAQGDRAAARALYEKAGLLLHAVLLADLGNARAENGLAGCLDCTGDLAAADGDSAAALRAARDAVAIRRTSLARTGGGRARWELSTALERLGDRCRTARWTGEARAAYEEELGIRRALVAAEGRDRGQARRDLTAALDRVGDACVDGGDLAGAGAAYAESLELRRALHAEAPENVTLARDLTVSLERASEYHGMRGEDDAAVASLREAVTIVRGLEERGARLAGERAEYERDLREAETARAVFAGERRPASPADHLALAYALAARGKPGPAVPHFEAALEDAAIRADVTRGDLDRGNLYSAARAAIAASVASSGEDKARLRALALRWLSLDVHILRAGLRAEDEKTRAAARQALRRRVELIERDPDLDPLRGAELDALLATQP